MIATTILCSCVGMIVGFAAVLVAFAPDYEGKRPCLLCIGLWLAQISAGFFVLAAHPQWLNP